MNSIQERIAHLKMAAGAAVGVVSMAHVQVRAHAKKATKPEDTEKVGTMLPVWPEPVGVMPTELTRTSLFGLPREKLGEALLDGVRLNSRIDAEVYYTGKRMSVRDETAWMACLRLARGVPMGERVYLNKTDLMRACGISNTGPNWNALANRLDRLAKASLTIDIKRAGKPYHMVTGLLNWGIELESGLMFIRLDPDGADLFNNLAYQPWEIRLSLRTEMAVNLLTYLSGHQQGKPHSVRLTDLKLWSGYQGRLDKFRTACSVALAELEEKGVIEKTSGRIDGNAARWTRVRSSELTLVQDAFDVGPGHVDVGPGHI